MYLINIIVHVQKNLKVCNIREKICILLRQRSSNPHKEKIIVK